MWVENVYASVVHFSPLWISHNELLGLLTLPCRSLCSLVFRTTYFLIRLLLNDFLNASSICIICGEDLIFIMRSTFSGVTEFYNCIIFIIYTYNSIGFLFLLLLLLCLGKYFQLNARNTKFFQSNCLTSIFVCLYSSRM